MTSRELRIGNVFIHNQKRVTVENIVNKSINLVFDKETLTVISFIPILELTPIKLNTDVLRRCGLRLDYNMYRIKGNYDFYLKRRLETFYLCVDHPAKELVALNYLHQLQNIIWDWFQIEIKFK